MADAGNSRKRGSDGQDDAGGSTQVTSMDTLDESERTQQIDSATLLALQEEQDEISDAPTGEHVQPDVTQPAIKVPKR